MSGANLKRAHEVIAAVERRDLAALTDLTDPAVDWNSAFALGEGGSYQGHDGMRQYVPDMRDAWEVVRVCFRPFREPEKALEAVGLAG